MEIYKYTDDNGRLIEISGYDEFECVAKHNDKQIGRFILEQWQDDFIYLDHMDINNAYQRAGIGGKMLELIVSVHGKSIIDVYTDPEFLGRGEEFPHLSTEGAEFLNKCKKMKILV